MVIALRNLSVIGIASVPHPADPSLPQSSEGPAAAVVRGALPGGDRPGRAQSEAMRIAALGVLFRSGSHLLRHGISTWRHPFVALSRLPGQASEPAQRFGHLHATVDAGQHHVDHHEGRMEMAAGLKLLDRHTGRSQRLGVGDALVPERIELGTSPRTPGAGPRAFRAAARLANQFVQQANSRGPRTSTSASASRSSPSHSQCRRRGRTCCP